ncbi:MULTISPECIES: pseudaminic acid synthase [unclassified Pseudoalteromonas]|uniref:pseudaminic acid synthase n=1 Tax=unclassified Pseudoalteromonas TaxID=194690 RepID=UPI000C068A24|nr:MULTISPECIES: pseudaminic acid synthase [unclassified Pseudoalteromonas]MDP2635453.1 pseudaminic acid synthase [Pseudoalteromonas sp. 1_MG-2023]PHN88808.1 pseudaminic acid synthase [Pseudoalteromonas sp. 3D05]TGE83393.1 pseudaminic acid synthase [Pseudoalteromonas sp. KS88]
MAFNSEITIDGRKIGPGHPVYIIAEMSANHGQDLEQAKALVRAAKEAGADAIKLQTYRADTLTMDCKLPHFEAAGPWQGQYLYDLYEGAFMPWDFHGPLIQLANEIGITIFSSPFDDSAVDLLESFDSPAYKIASPELIDHDLIRKVATTGKPVIMSTGGATLAEIDEAVKVARQAGIKDLAILKCTSSYPAPPESINLKTIPHLADLFKVPIGLSDHTLGNHVPVASVAMKATIIEKHFVMSKDDETADSFFSMTPDELEDLVQGVRQVELALGNVHFPSEPSKARRCLFAARDIAVGEVLSKDNVVNLRPGVGELMPKDLGFITGRIATNSIKKGMPLTWQHVGAIK